MRFLIEGQIYLVINLFLIKIEMDHPPIFFLKWTYFIVILCGSLNWIIKLNMDVGKILKNGRGRISVT
jgi:hypothetical protein